MVPHPKRKLSSGRRDRRRSQDALGAINLVQLSHTVCPGCGHYQGREVISKETKKK
jgi:large subunit ribosomal protein L32